jgi:hypothetical protein
MTWAVSSLRYVCGLCANSPAWVLQSKQAHFEYPRGIGYTDISVSDTVETHVLDSWIRQVLSGKGREVICDTLDLLTTLYSNLNWQFLSRYFCRQINIQLNTRVFQSLRYCIVRGISICA